MHLATGTVVAIADAPGESPWRRATADFFASRGAGLGASALLILVIAAAIAPWITPQDPYDLTQLSLADAYHAPGETGSAGYLHLLGTDDQGRDIYSAIVYGLRTSLLVGLICTAVALAIGLLCGLVAAFFGGWLDSLVMRLVDLFLAFPPVLVALILASLLGGGLENVMIALIAARWAFFARTVRSAALVESRKEYIEAAKSLGLPNTRILLGHLLPNSVPPVIVVATITVAQAIVLEATLSFLGVGTPLTQPSLGRLISNGYVYLLSGEYWISVFPGLALLLAMMAINLVGDRVREVLDPRLQK